MSFNLYCSDGNARMLRMSVVLFDARKNFFDLFIVRTCFVAILFVSVACALIIFAHSNLRLDLSYVGFNGFIEIFKVPIGVLALNIPVIAILAAFHKSEQTRLQIEMSNVQNNFSNYYKHIEEFKKVVASYYQYEERCDVELLHKKLFPEAIEGRYSISPIVKAELKGLTIKLCSKYLGAIDEIYASDGDLTSFFTSVVEFFDCYEIYNYLYYKRYNQHHMSTYAMPTDSMLVEYFAKFLTDTIRMLGFVKVIFHFDHTREFLSHYDQFLNEIDIDKFSSDTNALLNRVLYIDEDSETKKVNTFALDTYQIASMFESVIKENINQDLLLGTIK